MPNHPGPNQKQTPVIGKDCGCSGEDIDHLKQKMQGLQAELGGHIRDGHVRAHLGKSFGRPEGEIREEIDQVQRQLINCNNQYK